MHLHLDLLEDERIYSFTIPVNHTAQLLGDDFKALIANQKAINSRMTLPSADKIEILYRSMTYGKIVILIGEAAYAGEYAVY